MTTQIVEKFIYNGEKYYLIDLERRLKYPVEGINSTAEGYFNEIKDAVFDLSSEELGNAIEEEGLITPQFFGMRPHSISTACWRGFHSTYEILNEELFLKEMIVGDVNSGHKSIQGVMPILNKDGEFCYQNLKVITRFTGRITLGKDLIDFFDILDPEMSFRTLLKMTFYKGKLAAIQDLSLGKELQRRIEPQIKQSKPLLDGVKPIGLLPSTDRF